MDDIIKQLEEKKAKYDAHIAKLNKVIRDIYRYNQESAKHYNEVAQHCKNEEDPAYHEFIGLRNGMIEANNNIHRYLDGAELDIW